MKSLFFINKKNRFKDIVSKMQKKECQNMLIHIHSSDGKKLKKRLEKLHKAFPNAKIFATVEEEKDKEPLIAFICLDDFNSIETIFSSNCKDNLDKCLELEITAILSFIKEYSENEQNSQLHILEQYRDAVDHAMIVSKTDKRGIITYINDNFCKISGYTREELIGKSHNIVRHPDTPKETFKEMWQTILSKKPWHGIIKNLRKDGTDYIVDAIIYPILDTSGEITEFIALRKDITEQIHDKEQLEAREAELQAILNNQDSIVLFVSQNDGILTINKRFFEYFDFKDTDDFKEKHSCICDLFIEEEGYIYPKAREDWLEFVSSNPEERHKVKMRDKNGKIRTFLLKANQIENDGRFVVNLSDITPLEEALIQAKLMEHTKSMFVANMSHEIRTPLNGILGFTELLLKHPVDSQIRRYLEIIHKSGKTLLGIVNDILDLSKIESGKMELSPIPADICKELESVVAIFAAKAREKHISYTAFIDPTIPKTIICDIQRLKQVLSNLIGNAVKFTPENGKVEVLIKTIKKEDNRIKLHFEVKDSGIGIKEEQKSKIFDLFSQADNSISREYGGTGLGLPISAKFIEMMGSHIEVDSEPQKGSTFWFDIWFDINDASLSIGSLESIEESVNIVFCKHTPEDCIMFETIKNYLEAWGISWTTRTSCDDIPFDTAFLFITPDTFEKGDKENMQKLLEQFPSLQIIWVESSSSIKPPEDNRIHKLEMPVVGSTLFDLLAAGLGDNFTKASISEDNIYNGNYSGKVLVAEDNPVNQMLISELLKDRGIDATIVENGIEALDELNRNQYDLVLMDVNMPKMDGIEATKKLRESGFKTPIVALTANVMAEEKSAYMKAGMNDHLSKPIETKALDIVLQKFLNTTNIEEEVESIEFDDIDYDHLGESLGLKNRKILRTLFAQFSKSVDSFLEDLESAINSKNIETLKDVIHRIKGATGNMRFENSFTLCKELEKELSSHNEINNRVKNMITKLMAQLWDLQNKIELHLNKEG
ncbi:ATP-binding protein [Hydrogenimonas thermophila]|uniref:response regulator n=1 Tax=Hydrogenimonas thermophila TaxID=223786 RepID=UPI002936DEF9|nr:response regulator [Hydrogenimonas thermophila]WOE69205.1 ATP-binding protein [Hydrogenimonas thermophila]WOE71715.1 ATP-binding protein [Hydrogenimonas thermophila]